MTLNITLVTSGAIYQSCDYRLSSLTTGSPEPSPSTKVVHLQYRDWFGCVTYTGIGRHGTRHTSELAAEWLTGKAGLSVDDAIELLRIEGSRWLRRFFPGQRHTFVLAAFTKDQPLMMVISNFQRWYGHPDDTAAKDLYVSGVRAPSRPVLLVTGQTQAVRRHDRRILKRVAERAPNDAMEVRRVMAQVTRNAAALAPNTVSPECLVHSFDKFRQGRQDVVGGQRTVPQTISEGRNTLEQLKPFLDKQFGPNEWTMGGMTTSGGGPGRSPPPPPKPCKIVVQKAPNQAQYEVKVLADAPGNRCIARAANTRGIVVGAASPSWQVGEVPCLWNERGELSFLQHLGGIGGGRAIGITEKGLIVGESELPNRRIRAARWTEIGEIDDLGIKLPGHCGAISANESGIIVGWSSLDANADGQDHFRPTRWTALGEPEVWEDLGGAWGEAVGVDEEGVALVRKVSGRRFSALLWRRDRMDPIVLPTSDCQGFLPTCMTRSGRIVGTITDRNGRQKAMEHSPDAGWQEFGLPAGAHLAAGTDETIAGDLRSGDLFVPWILRRGSAELEFLPYPANHHCYVLGVSESGRIWGKAAGDHCTHALIWSPS